MSPTAWEYGGNDICTKLELDPNTLPAVFAFAPGTRQVELGVQVTKTSYESKQELDDTFSFLEATVRMARTQPSNAQRDQRGGGGGGYGGYGGRHSGGREF